MMRSLIERREQLVQRAVALGRAFEQAGSTIVLTTTDFAPGYADAPEGLADSPWALPKEGLPLRFADADFRDRCFAGRSPPRQAADERFLRN